MLSLKYDTYSGSAQISSRSINKKSGYLYFLPKSSIIAFSQ